MKMFNFILKSPKFTPNRLNFKSKTLYEMEIHIFLHQKQRRPKKWLILLGLAAN